MTGVDVSVVSPAPRSAWREVADADPFVLVTQTPAWNDALVASGSYRDASRMYEFSGRRVILPMVARRRIPGVLSSYPSAWGMGGVIADHDVEVDEIRAVFRDLRAIGAQRVQIRPNPLRAALWEAAKPPEAITIDRNAHVIDLAGGFEEVWMGRFKAEARRKTRIAEKAEIEVTVGRDRAAIRDFFHLYDLSVQRWARRQHEPPALARWRARRRESLEKWDRIVDILDGRIHIFLARLGNRPVAGIVVLQGTNAHYTRGAMDAELAGETRANFLLQKMAIEAACADGCRWYHMGESGQSDGLAMFKSRFGAEAHAYAEYRLERFPLTRLDRTARTAVKRVIGFRDA
jgi:hypothetical protein